MTIQTVLVRRVLLIGAIFFLEMGSAASANERCESDESDARPPNIVIIYADDMGYGDLGIQNADSKIPTPHLDQLAREGMRFSDAHSSSGWCTQSRYSLLTGRYHWRKFHYIIGDFEDSAFDAERLTLPEMLQQNGYTTACIGKWHLGWNWDALRYEELRRTEPRSIAVDAFDWSLPIPNGPLAHGFDYYFGDDVPNFPPYCWIENDRIVEAPTVPYVPFPRALEGRVDGRLGPMVEGWRLDEVMPRLTEQAVAWIGQQRNSEQPFFLYFPWTSPHSPIVPTEEWANTTEAGPYGDFVHQSDNSAGLVLAALEENGLADNTLVVFTCDNGAENYAYNRIRNHDHFSSGPLRGLKRDLWEGGHRVPFVIRWPGVIEAGTVCDELVSQIDLMATFASLIDYELPEDAAEDSHNLLPLLTGEHQETAPIRTTHVHNTRPNHYAIRHHQWLLVDSPSGHVSRVPDWFNERQGYQPNPHPGELYDLSDDISQLRNLYGEQPEVVAELRELLRTIREEEHTSPRLAP